MGVVWGGLMWLIMSVLPLLGKGDTENTWQSALLGLPIWAAGGIAFGFFMWFFLGRKSGKINEHNKSR